MVNDGAANCNTGTRNINVTAVNDAPAVTTTGTSLAYTENGAATAIDTWLDGDRRRQHQPGRRHGHDHG